MQGTDILDVSSPAFENNGRIPSRYTCDGDDINPPLSIGNVPDSAKSLVLIMDDPDAPAGTWVHWVMWNIPLTGSIAEDSQPGVGGKNSWGRNDYGGPCPPSGTHRYFFKVYALDTMLELKNDAAKTDVLDAIEGHALAQGQLIGLYSRE